jgi:hypothetical protein
MLTDANPGVCDSRPVLFAGAILKICGREVDYAVCLSFKEVKEG